MSEPVTAPGIGYRLVALLILPLWLLHALLHGRQHGLRDYLSLRRARTTVDREPRIWVHAASVGEVRAITPLVRALQARGEAVLLTSFTATGYRTIQRDFGDSLASAVIPVDSPRYCRRFLAVTKTSRKNKDIHSMLHHNAVPTLKSATMIFITCNDLKRTCRGVMNLIL